MSGLFVETAGVLALLQDGGRYGRHDIGLTTGGPMDKLAFRWANVLCGNTDNATAIELTVGGLVLTAQKSMCIAVTGADISFSINGAAAGSWRSHWLEGGDVIRFGFASIGCRIYLAVAGGFKIGKQFGSTATVVREGLGGLHGMALRPGDMLPVAASDARPCYRLPEKYRPNYSRDITVRVLLGYQARDYSPTELQWFLGTRYTVSKHCDRMAYRLIAPDIGSERTRQTMLSEGISLGAIQLPPDGQPIVMMADRQTIGGYPKIATALSNDLTKLAQLVVGDTVQFQTIEVAQAREQLLLSQRHFEQAQAALEIVL